MHLIIEKKFLINANGDKRSLGGHNDLKKALKLKSQGLARIKFLGRQVVMVGQYTSIDCERYRVTFL